MSTNAKWVIGLTVMTLALFIGSTFETRLPTALAALLTYVVVVAQRGRKSDRAGVKRTWFARWIRRAAVSFSVISIVLVTAAWRIGNQVGGSFNPVYVGIETVAHACFFLLLMVWMLRPHRGHVSMLPFGLLMVLLCVAGGGGSLSLAAQTTVALAACLGFTVASQIILGIKRGTNGEVFARPILAGNRSQASDRSKRETANWVGPAFSMLTLSVLMMATTAIANGTNYVLPVVQEKLQKQLEATFDSLPDETQIGGTRYVSGSHLGSIRQHMLGSPQDIALRIHSDVAPGYLRGNAFDFYNRRRWYSAAHGTHQMRADIASMVDRPVTPSGPAVIPLQHSSVAARRRFLLAGPQSDRVVHLEIQNEPLKGNTVFLPLTTRWIEASSRELNVTSHGIVRLGVDVTEPYVAGVGLTPVGEGLDLGSRQALLHVPDFASEQTRRIAMEVCDEKSTTRRKAESISQFFQSRFMYSLTAVRVPRRTDPISHFLETRHAAHCEYFATATVLVLRSAGIPARYVTGYVADEYDDELTMWVARNRDAHAWAEAYDDTSGQWFPVESTPGRVYRTIDSESETIDMAGLFDVFRSDSTQDDDSFFSRIFGWLFSMRATDPLFVVFRFAQLPLFCVLVFILWTRMFRRGSDGADPMDVQSLKMLRKVDRALRKHSLIRRPSETLDQFADRIDSHLDDASTGMRAELRNRIADASSWYRRYASARYQGELPDPWGV